MPPAELGYLGSFGGSEHYKVMFTADADLLNVFKPEDSPVGGLLRCSLVSDVPNEHSSERYVAKGLISAIEPKSTTVPFVFSSSIMFVENLNDGRSYRDLKAPELREILSVRQSVPCVYWATAYGFKPYRSGILQVPVADILREMDK
ncbi:hypothetical protein ACIGKL_04380 [Pseudomonas sp. NPDC077186]|uniref:hypothetical protein n=1 Tax=Pseudomonas sp. NPDC077186 TaxID=3364421 RepID=UPI0037CAB0DD